jgi:hypothetical protein
MIERVDELAALAGGEPGPRRQAAVWDLMEIFALTDDRAILKAAERALATHSPQDLSAARMIRFNRHEEAAARANARSLTAEEALAKAKAKTILWADGPAPDRRVERILKKMAAEIQKPGDVFEVVNVMLENGYGAQLPGILFEAAKEWSVARRALARLCDHLDPEVAAAAMQYEERYASEIMLTEEGVTLLALAAEHPGVIPLLVKAFLKKPHLRGRLGTVLSFVVKDHPEVLDRLLPALRGDDDDLAREVCGIAHSATSATGGRAEELFNALLDLLPRLVVWTEEVEFALISLEQGPTGADLVAVVVARIRARPSWDDSYAMYNLLDYMAREHLGGPAARALEALQKDPDPEVRKNVSR